MREKRSSSTPLFLIVILIVAIVSGIWIMLKSSPPETSNSENLKIATSIFPLYDITSNITGNTAEVVQILPSGSSPHTFEPTINESEAVSGSDLLIIVGLGLDDWAAKIFEENELDFIDLSKSLEDERLDGDSPNPHYWLSIDNTIKAADIIKEKIIKMDPQNKATYQNNYTAYKNNLEKLKTRSQEKIDKLENKKIITFHNSFSYFAGDFGLEILGVIAQFPGKEPTTADLTKIGSLIKKNEIEVLFSEPQLSESIVSALADDYDIEILILDPLGGLEERDSYIRMMDYNVDTIVEGLY